MKTNGWRILISGFILLNLVAVPFGPQSMTNPHSLGRIFLPYLWRTRLLQSWPLFVPSPRKYAMKYRVDITFKDGTTATWRRPYPPNWSFFERHLAYNFQKWDLASNYLETPNLLWHDLAMYMQRLYWNEKNPPETISLVRSTANWPPPNETGYVRSDESLLNWSDHPIFTYHVSEKRMVAL